ncbi:MAG TPA: hypothetical protein VHZ74_13010 [Bryobacteraceae bacterium]|jgi:hypothetical protein|nr:hypothetical protein [Bryobacteraceae bacterium]
MKGRRNGKKLFVYGGMMACVKSGQKYVLVSNGKVFQIANQNFAGTFLPLHSR